MELQVQHNKIFFFKDNLWSKSIANNIEGGIQSNHLLWFYKGKYHGFVSKCNKYARVYEVDPLSKKLAILMYPYLTDEEPYVHMKAF